MAGKGRAGLAGPIGPCRTACWLDTLPHPISLLPEGGVAWSVGRPGLSRRCAVRAWRRRGRRRTQPHSRMARRPHSPAAVTRTSTDICRENDAKREIKTGGIISVVI